MRVTHWNWEGGTPDELGVLAGVLARPGVVIVRFRRNPAVEVPRKTLEVWTRSRAVTVAHVDVGILAEPALGIALCADLVYLQKGTRLELPDGRTLPSPGLMLAAGRAGHRALRRVLLGEGSMAGEQVVELGLAHALVHAGEELPLPLQGSLSALTAARDLLRTGARGENALSLEAATFRLLFAGGDPSEGAAAFLERRPPRFSMGRDDE